MADDEKLEGTDEEVWNAILACEQILEAMPNDRHSLRTLSNAYEQVGDLVKAKEYMLRLGEVVLSEQDETAAVDMQKRLAKYSDDEKAQELLAALNVLKPWDSAADTPEEDVAVHDLDGAAPTPAKSGAKAKTSAPTKGSAKTGKTTGQRVEISLTEEIALAWSLHEAGVFDEEEYSSVVDDLTRLSGGDTELTISVFHVLQDRQSPNLESALTSASAAYGTPIIALSNFAIARETAELLPMDYMIRRGVVPYERMGNRVLVAVMNPLDKQLRQEVDQKLGRDCFYYLVSPVEFDAALSRMKETLDKDPDDDE
jgi:tetratricopeptide (TPR) repeat protein